MNKKNTLEQRISAIEARNLAVEANKSWETSWTRKICIAILTYFVVCLYLTFIVHINPWVNAVVPTIGFLLSTLSIGIVKKFWRQYIYNS